jgi:hypothetical protein
MTWSHIFSSMFWKDLSRRIPALAIRMWMVPKASRPALTIASPSSAEQTAATAFPPTGCKRFVRCMELEGNRVSAGDKRQHTSFDFLDDLGGSLFAHVVDNDVGAKFCKHQRVASSETSPSAGDDDSLALEVDLFGTLRVGGQFLRLLEPSLWLVNGPNTFLSQCACGRAVTRTRSTYQHVSVLRVDRVFSLVKVLDLGPFRGDSRGGERVVSGVPDGACC